ncbi:hypothetical protein [Azospirillum sp. TSO22-1]|uniref:hypothetical protein n=1 Tax=Azospirillum sp. TSO22-1 TaxID=716789 RepID=UPI000D60CADC|nr:hypothetical protein [Azospirillum sp. TSO22-1]PWC52860.1 hypothetical protein TSO221_12620 [Azospirillum sp. TSO22-1]
MQKDRTELLRELSAHVGRPDFAEIAARITREMQQPAPEPPKPAPRNVGAPRRPSTPTRRAS